VTENVIVVTDLHYSKVLRSGAHPVDASSVLCVLPDRYEDESADGVEITPIGWEDLKRNIVDTVAGHTPRTCLILMHLSTVSAEARTDVPNLAAQGRLQIVERELKSDRRLGFLQLLEVYGYHTASSAISDVLNGLKRGELSGLQQALRKVLDQAEQGDAFTEMSVLKHQVIGLFLPMNLRIQHALANGLRISEPGLAERLRTARDLLAASGSKITRPAAKEALDESLALLAASTNLDDPRLASFHEWLNSLDSTLDTVRKELVR
jgi:hypothetical protein